MRRGSTVPLRSPPAEAESPGTSALIFLSPENTACGWSDALTSEGGTEAAKQACACPGAGSPAEAGPARQPTFPQRATSERPVP